MAKRTVRKSVSTGKAVADQIAQEIMETAEARAEELAIDRELGLEDEDEDLDAQIPVEGRDIFEEAFQRLEAQNDLPKFIIHKNGTYHAVVSHPYSWEQLQKEHGAGNYRVTAKSVARNIYAGQQTMIIGGPVKDDSAPAPQAAQQQAPPAPSPMEIFAMMEQLREKAEQKSRDANQNQSNIMAILMQNMTQMQQQSTAQFQTLILEMSKSNMAMFQTMQTNNMQAFKELNQQIQNTQKKSDGELSALQLLKLIQDSETRAEERALKLMEMVEERAEALASNGKDDSKEPSEKPTVFERALASFVPMMQHAAAANHPLPPPQAPQTAFQRPAPPPGPAQAGAPQGAPKPAPQRPVLKPSNSIKPLPKAAPPPSSTEAQITKKENPVQVNGANFTKEQVLEFIAPKIGAAMVSRTNPAVSAGECLKELEKIGITRQNVLETFTWDDFQAGAKKFGLPMIAVPWLKEFFDALQVEQKPPAEKIPEAAHS